MNSRVLPSAALAHVTSICGKSNCAVAIFYSREFAHIFQTFDPKQKHVAHALARMNDL
jgi:hypothetical protein